MRRAGVLCAVFSLPGKYGIGDFGKEVVHFIDILKDSKVKIWQVLPLNPVGFGNSPYQAYSSFAGDTIYIDLEALYKDGLLKSLPKPFRKDSTSIDYPAVREYKEKYLKEAFKNFKANEEYNEFISQEWVKLYAVFRAFQHENDGRTWNEWPEEQKNWIKDKKLDLSKYEEMINYEMFLQYEFYIQWNAIKVYANKNGVKIMGDIPFYVGLNSLDVWMNQDDFKLDSKGFPISVAGVPPDYFSADGQRWGNPIYDWEHMKSDNFKFWKERVTYTAKMFDLIRIDHFRAFDSYWVIPAESPTAKVGDWWYAPGYDLFNTLLPLLPDTEIVAEDLGMMRQEVYWLRDHYNFPGMNVLQFTLFDPNFGLREHMITYTGTHDNDTVLGWWQDLSKGQRKALKYKMDRENSHKVPVHEKFVRYCLEGTTDTAIVAVQDILGLGKSARVNTPGTVGSPDWEWKLNSLSDLRKSVSRFGRMVVRALRA